MSSSEPHQLHYHLSMIPKPIDASIIPFDSGAINQPFTNFLVPPLPFHQPEIPHSAPPLTRPSKRPRYHEVIPEEEEEVGPVPNLARTRTRGPNTKGSYTGKFPSAVGITQINLVRLSTTSETSRYPLPAWSVIPTGQRVIHPPPNPTHPSYVFPTPQARVIPRTPPFIYAPLQHDTLPPPPNPKPARKSLAKRHSLPHPHLTSEAIQPLNRKKRSSRSTRSRPSEPLDTATIPHHLLSSQPIDLLPRRKSILIPSGTMDRRQSVPIFAVRDSELRRLSEGGEKSYQELAQRSDPVGWLPTSLQYQSFTDPISTSRFSTQLQTTQSSRPRPNPPIYLPLPLLPMLAYPSESPFYTPAIYYPEANQYQYLIPTHQPIQQYQPYIPLIPYPAWPSDIRSQPFQPQPGLPTDLGYNTVPPVDLSNPILWTNPMSFSSGQVDSSNHQSFLYPPIPNSTLDRRWSSPALAWSTMPQYPSTLPPPPPPPVPGPLPQPKKRRVKVSATEEALGLDPAAFHTNLLGSSPSSLLAFKAMYPLAPIDLFDVESYTEGLKIGFGLKPGSSSIVLP